MPGALTSDFPVSASLCETATRLMILAVAVAHDRCAASVGVVARSLAAPRGSSHCATGGHSVTGLFLRPLCGRVRLRHGAQDVQLWGLGPVHTWAPAMIYYTTRMGRVRNRVPTPENTFATNGVPVNGVPVIAISRPILIGRAWRFKLFPDLPQHSGAQVHTDSAVFFPRSRLFAGYVLRLKLSRNLLQT